MFNFDKNLLIEGTPLCYRKYLFGLFPSTIHIKPAAQLVPKKQPPVKDRYDNSFDMIMNDDSLFSLYDDIRYLNPEEEENGFEEEGMEESMEDESYDHAADRVADDASSTEKGDLKDEDDIIEGDIVVVTPPSNEGFLFMKSKRAYRPVTVHYPRSLSLKSLPEPNTHKEKERRAVVVKVIGTERVEGESHRLTRS